MSLYLRLSYHVLRHDTDLTSVIHEINTELWIALVVSTACILRQTSPPSGYKCYEQKKVQSQDPGRYTSTSKSSSKSNRNLIYTGESNLNRV